MSDDVFALSFGAGELAFLAGLLGASPRLLQSPFAGWSDEQVQKALQEARQSLATRQYIQDQPDGELGVEPVVTALVGALAFAESALTVTCLHNAKTQPAVLRVHYASGLIVEHEERDGTYCLTAVRNGAVLARRLQHYVELAAQPAAAGTACTLASSDAHEAQWVAVVEGEGAAAQQLKEAGVQPGGARALARALAETVRQSAWLALRWEGAESRRLDSFTLLEGRDGMWLLQRLADSPDRLEAIPCDAAAAARRVDDVIRAIILMP